jgi:hypothetical protein
MRISKRANKGSRVVASFEKKKGRLLKKGFIFRSDDSFELTEQGLFASRIYTDELVVTNIFCSLQQKN